MRIDTGCEWTVMGANPYLAIYTLIIRKDMNMILSISLALPSWCMVCKAITGTSKYKNGPFIQKYCTKCGNPK